MRIRQGTTIALVSIALTLLAGCSKKEETPAAAPASSASSSGSSAPTSSNSAAPSSTSASSAAPSGSVIASAQYANDPSVRCDLLGVKRVSGGALLARWRIVNTGAKAVNYDFSWTDVYYIDPAENKKYSNLTDAEGKRILDIWYGTLGPGEQRISWAKYPAPPATSKRISLNVPKFAPFEDVPVTE